MRNHTRLATMLIAAAAIGCPGIVEAPYDKPPKPLGLREAIATAETEAEIQSLLREGDSFTLASEKTRRSWKATARRRLAELKGGAK
jgi:hypothetical protein